MDVLIVEPLAADVLHWLGARYAVRYAPELAADVHAFRELLGAARSVVIPPSVALDATTLRMAPSLRTVGRLSAGVENIDLDACAAAGVEVVRPARASAQAEAEFAVGALLQMLRRVPVLSAEGQLVGRELGACCVGLVGMTPTAKPLSALLSAFGSRVVGYDPGVHASDPLWKRWAIEPVGLRELMERCDAVCVILAYYNRYQGLLGHRYLSQARKDQVLLSLAPSSVFDEYALARALSGGQLAAAWLDSAEPGLQAGDRPLAGIDTLQVTPRVASTTRESRSRAGWAVARRIAEMLGPSQDPGFSPDPSIERIDLSDGPGPG